MSKIDDTTGNLTASNELSNINSVIEFVTSHKNWKTMASNFKQSQEIFFLANGGNLSILTHLVSDFKRQNVLKRYVLPTEIVHFSNMVREADHATYFRKWLEHEIVLTQNPFLFCVASNTDSYSIMDALNCSSADKFTKFLLTFNSPQPSNNNYTHIDMGVSYYATGEIALLQLGYMLLELIHSPPKKIPPITFEITKDFS